MPTELLEDVYCYGIKNTVRKSRNEIRFVLVVYRRFVYISCLSPHSPGMTADMEEHFVSYHQEIFIIAR